MLLDRLWHTWAGVLERMLLALLLAFVLVDNLLWSAIVPFTRDPYGAPDEIHHFEVPYYAFIYHRYPVFGLGRDLYIRVPPGLPDDIYHRIYGWYATNPWGSYLYGAATMFALGWTPLAGTIYTARLSSVIMGVLIVYLAYQIARQLFPAKLDLALGVPFFIACIPQFTYVSAYFSADMFSILCTTLVIYAWVAGIQNGFGWRSSLFLGLGLGLSALARLNCWMIVFPFSLVLLLLFCRESLWNRLARTGLVFLIPTVVFMVWFVYNQATYGDILAKQVSDQAWQRDRPSLVSYVAQGYTLVSFLKDTPWVWNTFTSSWCRLGYGFVSFSPWYYSVILGFCFASVSGLTLGFVRHVRQKSGIWRSWRFQVIALFALINVLVVAASLYNSFYNDFQPQGRYLFTALVPFSTLLVLGLRQVAVDRWGRWLVWIIAGAWMALLQAAGFYIYLVGMLVRRMPANF